jgi:hypothetical protein
MTDSQNIADNITTENPDTETVDDRVSDVIEELERVGFSTDEYHKLAQTLLIFLAIDHESMITEESSLEEAGFLTFMATCYTNAERLIAIEDIDEDSESDKKVEDEDDIE